MIPDSKDVPPVVSPSLSQIAEMRILDSLPDIGFLADPYVQRRLASYVAAGPVQKDKLILELLDFFWGKSSDWNQVFSAFKDFDQVLLLLGRKGHFVHQFEVFMLGLTLIDRVLRLKPSAITKFGFNSSEKILFTWLLTSTAHDIGLPFALSKFLISNFTRYYKKLKMTVLSSKFRKIARVYKIGNEPDLIEVTIGTKRAGKCKTLNIEDLILGEIKTVLRVTKKEAKNLQDSLRSSNNHGYVSSLILCRIYFEDQRNSKSWRTEGLKKAACAVALHALPKKHESNIKKMNFYSNPFAFVLTLVDNLQDWERSDGQNQLWPSYHLMDFSVSNNQIHIFYLIEHRNWTKRVRNRVEKSLREKERKLRLIPRPNPPLNLEITIDFTTNENFSYTSIRLQY